MKRIVLCFDGTWQSVDDPSSVSNVVRVAQAVKAVAENGVDQICYYQAGVGSDGGIDRILGGVFGVGLQNNVKRALAFLSLNWTEDGDEIYIFGFSRGAYTARAVAGVIGAVGGIPRQEHFDRLADFWNYYRIDPEVRNADTPEARAKKQEMRDLCYPDDAEKGKVPIIKCLGVWDTVGSYGIPAGYGLSGLARRLTSWTKGFHDHEFGRHVGFGLHALAIDERRRGFPPTAWTIEKGKSLPAGNHVEQVWFAGVHSNIGGSYRYTGLSDLALIWMMARVEDLTGLEFDVDVVADNFWPCAACSLYNSVSPWALLSRLMPHRRKVLSDTAVHTRKGHERQYINEMVHWSVIERRGRIGVADETRYVTYGPKNLPKVIPGERVAGKTDREAELINACRENGNARFKACARNRPLDDTKRGRRARRLAGLQAAWRSLTDPQTALANTPVRAAQAEEAAAIRPEGT
jgi:uncharacterized protein (DUF2235 family)